MKKVGIYIKRSKAEAGTVAKQVIGWLQKRNLTPLVPETEAQMYDIPGGLPVGEVIEQSDLMVVLGGDGTLLAAARQMAGRQIPVLGVNLGGMGFLTEIRLHELPEALEMFVAGKLNIIERLRLKVSVRSESGEKHYEVLNDVVVTKSALARIFDLRIAVGGNYLNTVKADGLIVSTPTGSTGYNLAAGGPVVHPQANGIIITPICPHMLSNRPVVVPADHDVQIELLGEADVYVTCDGQEGQEMHKGDVVEVTNADKPLLIAKSHQRNYFDVLREKLHYGKR